MSPLALLNAVGLPSHPKKEALVYRILLSTKNWLYLALPQIVVLTLQRTPEKEE